MTGNSGGPMTMAKPGSNRSHDRGRRHRLQASQMLRDEEVVGSNPATPTAYRSHVSETSALNDALERCCTANGACKHGGPEECAPSHLLRGYLTSGCPGGRRRGRAVIAGIAGAVLHMLLDAPLAKVMDDHGLQF